jgi:hypothetical protein
VPGYETIRTVLRDLDVGELETRLQDWASQVVAGCPVEAWTGLAFDGKTTVLTSPALNSFQPSPKMFTSPSSMLNSFLSDAADSDVDRYVAPPWGEVACSWSRCPTCCTMRRKLLSDTGCLPIRLITAAACW